MGPHPAVAATRLAVRRDLAHLPPGAVVVVACSGGADSLALAAATVFEAREPAWHVIGATIDHGLQEDSAARADTVVRQLAALGVAETMTARVQVEARGQGPEAAAREARYAVLEEIAARTGAAAVLLGHTRDDQAETVLLGLTRGSGGRSLAGMRRSFDVFRRPLLDLSRVQTETACREQGLEWWSDPHNTDPRFTRSRVRQTVLPMLEAELGPGVAETLARTADQLRADMEHLDAETERTLAALATGADDPEDRVEHSGHREHGVLLEVAALQDLSTSLRRRVLRAAALAAGAPSSDLFFDHVLAVEDLITAWRGQRWVDLPGGLRASRHDGTLRIGPAPSEH